MVKLYPHQIKALGKLKNGCILCGGVGTGKSLTSLSYYYLQQGGSREFLEGGPYTRMREHLQDLYIITTAKKRDDCDWDIEMTPFLLSREEKMYKNTVIVDSWNNIQKYKDIKGAFFIFDEQRVIGRGAWVKAFLKIAQSNNWILLSATPGDTWSDYIPVFIANGFFKNRTEFDRNHVIYKRFSRYPQIDRYVGEGRLLRMRNDILVEMKFDKHTIRHNIDVYAGFDKSTYKEVQKSRWNIWKQEPIKNAGEYCYCLRRVVNEDESRQMALLELLEDHETAIIFYNFDYELELLRDIIPAGKDVGEWNGHKHDSIPDSNLWVFLVQYAAGSEGWNCIRTDTIIFWSQTYSYRVLEQASGRIDRLNTPYKDLYYYHLKSRSEIDRRIEVALKKKEIFNEKAFTGDIQFYA